MYDKPHISGVDDRRETNRTNRLTIEMSKHINISPVKTFYRSPTGFLLPVILLAVLLVIGSFHPSQPTKSQRINSLDNIIKCPVCADISIAQSDAQIAGQLRSSVRKWVDEGKTNSWIESAVVAKFGSNEILDPQNNLIFIIPAAVIIAALLILFTYYIRRFRSYKNLSLEEEALT
ncbi:MAG: cytochrome c-type biogenesis protein CcmH [Firmicutes bacterium]|nr:cytochrome c-type biogenesis protein CcmH [Bacillota bacterium]